MSALLGTRTTAVWLLLVAATLVAWRMGHGIGLGNPDARRHRDHRGVR